MNFVQVCPVEIVNGSCPEPMVWREVASTLPLTFEQFSSMVPAFVAVLFTAWGFKKLIQLFIK
jgi:hypothetical protein